jgi:hypothetical protein
MIEMGVLVMGDVLGTDWIGQRDAAALMRGTYHGM